MLQCEICSNWSHCEFVKVFRVIADNHHYVYLFCIKSHLLLVSELRSEISHLKARIIFEKSSFCEFQSLVSSLSVSSSPPLPTSSTKLTTLPLSLPNIPNLQPPSSGIPISLHYSVTSLPFSSAPSASPLPFHSTHPPPATIPSSSASTPSLSLNHSTAPLIFTTAAPTIITAVPSITTPSSFATSLPKSSWPSFLAKSHHHASRKPPLLPPPAHFPHHKTNSHPPFLPTQSSLRSIIPLPPPLPSLQPSLSTSHPSSNLLPNLPLPLPALSFYHNVSITFTFKSPTQITLMSSSSKSSIQPTFSTSSYSSIQSTTFFASSFHSISSFFSTPPPTSSTFNSLLQYPNFSLLIRLSHSTSLFSFS